MPKNDLDDLACAAFDFLTPVVRLPKAKSEMVKVEEGEERAGEVARGLIGCVLAYTQVTRANVSSARR